IELLSEVEWVYNHPDCCKTLVLDTADWAERLCIEAVCAQHQVDGIEAFSYGKGYVYAQEEFGRLLDKLELVRKQGIHIVIVAHAMMRKFEQPEETGAYDRWELKLSKKIAPMVREWVDALVFVNYKVLVVNVDGKGATKGKNKVQCGKRVMYTTHHACWDAKNRFGWPEEAEFDYSVVRGVIEGGTTEVIPATRTSSVAQQGGATPSPEGKVQENPSALARAVERAAVTPAQSTPQQTPTEAAESPQEAAQGDVGAMYAGLPPALARMMREAQVTPDEVKYVIAQKGIYPADTPWAVIVQNQQFMQGWLLHPQVWPKVVEAVRGNREETPF
ncbi:MAG: AAA family ATPase, partial [Oscillospiraceae bacterium]|nr:AAA family ATPase [Oscillospiraceae bacterium]